MGERRGAREGRKGGEEERAGREAGKDGRGCRISGEDFTLLPKGTKFQLPNT